MAESKEVKVKARDMVDVYGTGKSKFLALGVKTNVHKVAAEKLIEAGKAAKTKADAEAIAAKLPKATADKK